MQPNLINAYGVSTPTVKVLNKLCQETVSDVASGFAHPLFLTDASEGAAPFYPLQVKNHSQQISTPVLPSIRSIDF